jgi:periplasmic divalent cation tolerance protein
MDEARNAKDFGVVWTTLPDEAQAHALARAIVEAGLGACVQRQPVRSTYLWQGALCDEAEWLLSIKTVRANFEPLARFIRDHHPYTVPEIVMLPWAASTPDYAQWVLETTRRAGLPAANAGGGGVSHNS